ncbi:LysR family transcriptional regulator [Altererythrobacter sp. KTW20L]|uniref:winged helix-turn-helix domain-containing protein n=1 Tax=Altererythrobacter sp. KTW20L TaxID=2942210 RepID=UPI0020BF835A|nr:LysR family transcriptional regulator [Altererythrobacter sp. KTW20L]MCL6251589.1 LysR family transcriptional regulator [Altererythrobacter sp. KTW20L]
MTTPPAPRLKVKAQILVGDEIAIGPGKADLLEAVERTGSISAAGRDLGISYRRTRDMIDVLNCHWGGAVVETAKGGPAHGGSVLTRRGREVLDAYRRLDAEMHHAAETHAAALLRLAGRE